MTPSSQSSFKIQGTDSLYRLSSYLTNKNFSPKHAAFAAAILQISEPSTYSQAVKSFEWRKAMG